MRIIRGVTPWLAFFVLLLFTVKFAHAQSYLGDEWDKYLQGVKGFTPTGQSGEELAISFVLNLIRIVRNVVGGVALIMGVLYGVRLVISRGQEDVITKQKTNFLYALLGFIILIVSENIAQIFNPERATTAQLIDFNAARDQLRDIVSYMKWLLGSIAVLMSTVSAVRLVTAQGEEEEVTTQKRNLTWSFMGLLLVLLASNIVNAIYVVRGPDETAAAAPQAAIGEFTGIIRLLLVLLGPMAIVFTIYAGYMYLTALDNEERANKAKRMIIEGVVAIVMIFGAYALVNTLTSAELGMLSTHMA
ncbi:MAG: pilin [Patescibacteria group bacterium]